MFLYAPKFDMDTLFIFDMHQNLTWIVCSMSNFKIVPTKILYKGSSMSNFKIVPTTILYKGMLNDHNEMCMMNIDSNVDDLKDYVGTSIYILKSRNPPISSRHVFNLTMSNFDAYRHILKKFKHWPHSFLTVRVWWKTFVMGVLEFL